MTNKKSLCFKSQNVPTGVSDCHNIISTVIKGEVLHEPKKLRYYRSYKTFDIENFNDDIEQIKINQTCHEVDSDYNEYEKDFINVLNKHAQGFQSGPVPGTFTRLRSCIVPAEITEPPPPPKISGGQNHKYDGR